MSSVSPDYLLKIKQRVAERRKAGDYPPGLENQLDRHYQEILRGFNFLSDEDDLQSLLRRLKSSTAFDATNIETWSPNPFKRLIHQLIAKLTIRQTSGVLNQVQQHANTLNQAFEALILIVDELQAGEGGTQTEILNNRSDIDKRLSAALDRLSLIEAELESLRSK